MAKFMVWLHTEPRAVVQVDVDDLPRDRATREKVLTEAALARLDESGGAEWETTNAFADWVDVTGLI